MITEICGVTVDDDGIIHVPEGAKYIIPKNPEIVAQVEARKAAMESGEVPQNEEETENASSEGNTEDGEKTARREKKDQLVKILIDKTGLGANFKFDEEETKAIQTSSMIHLVEVESRELEAVESVRMMELHSCRQ